MMWTRLTAALTVIDICLFIGEMVIEESGLVIGFMVPNLIYKLYALGTVNAFVEEGRTVGTGDMAPPGEPTPLVR
jgi:hypothetical protein